MSFRIPQDDTYTTEQIDPKAVQQGSIGGSLLGGGLGAIIGSIAVPGIGGLVGFGIGSGIGSDVGGAVGAEVGTEEVEVAYGQQQGMQQLSSSGGMDVQPWMWEKTFRKMDKLAAEEEQNVAALEFREMLEAGYNPQPPNIPSPYPMYA